MALQLRRGTDAERSAVTFAVGELVYTTDTKKLYVGDGATAGGNSASADTLDSLTDTDLTGSTNNDVLTYNASTSKWESVSVPGLGRIALTDLTDVSPGPFQTGEILQFNGVQFAPTSINQIINPGSSLNLNLIADDSTMMVNATTSTFTGDLIGNAFGAHTGTLDGDLTGSVFGDDSSVMIDSVGKRVVANIESPSITTTKEIDVTASSDNSGLVLTGVAGAASTGPKLIVKSSNGTPAAPTVSVGATTGDGLMDLHGMGFDGADYKLAGMIRVAVDLDSTVATNVVPGRINLITANSSGNLNNLMTFNSSGNLGIGLPRPLEKLHVNGNARATGFVQFGSLTTTERDALTAANGMVIYNSSDNKFQGYENGGWVNLI